MEIEGEENLTSCKARELFSVGKEWIEKLWKEKGKEVLRIEISLKSIGRNPGFIIDVKLSDEESGIRYYAKIQTAQIDTIMIHYLLKYTKCGPDEFIIEFNGALSSKQCIVEAAKVAPWLRSKEAFLELLQRVCGATDTWPIQTDVCTNSVPSSPSTCSSETSSSSSSSTDSSCSSSGGNISQLIPVVPLLFCFRNSSVPNLDVSHDTYYTMQDLIDSYRGNWVARWNDCLRHFLEWFPFPDATPSVEVVEASSSDVTSTTAADATNAPTKVSIQTCTAVGDASAAPLPSCTITGTVGTSDVIFSASSDEVLDNTNENKGEDTRNPEDARTCAKRNAAEFECDTKDKRMRV